MLVRDSCMRCMVIFFEGRAGRMFDFSEQEE